MKTVILYQHSALCQEVLLIVVYLCSFKVKGKSPCLFESMGVGIQLIDDVLDFTGTSASLGKGSLSDIQLGIVTAPILFAMEEFPQLHAVVYQGFDSPENIDIALEYLGKSHGIQRTRELAMKHANLAATTIESLPESNDERVIKSRRALVELTQRVITRNK
ncbi:solanesyl diphosphate synthase 3, chloroplastic/mitochondrial-like [Hibiscus syriacus]|uniref:solanesyl diphosphate synthase 3, chloroplastic/mitochondrial-like n=1 Tax=Hibiscus syriacus TaxID=106335 RepID=UPI001924C380|nr:solanesyl diphosphate synthase 3, chloroplastic/mitochondrial-like [Hibiscus syriacus]